MEKNVNTSIFVSMQKLKFMGVKYLKINPVTLNPKEEKVGKSLEYTGTAKNIYSNKIQKKQIIEGIKGIEK